MQSFGEDEPRVYRYVSEETYYNNGQKRCEHNYKNGKPDGKQEGWDGQKRYEHNYKNGKPDGKQEGWYRDVQNIMKYFTVKRQNTLRQKFDKLYEQ